MFRLELAKASRRLRTWLLAALAAAVAALPAVVLASSSGSGGGPPFLDLVRRNGLLEPLTAIALIQPFFLPLAVGLLAGDAIAGEASAGTLRYLLLRPVPRARLVLAKLPPCCASWRRPRSSSAAWPRWPRWACSSPP
jgi:ABC-2 type transport system permease protein